MGIKSKTVKNYILEMKRCWEPRLNRILNKHESKSYKLLSYNILSQDLLVEHLHLYYGIGTKFLNWPNRFERLKREIKYIQPDILCLQEMQYNHIKDFVKNLSETGAVFEYVFKKKSGSRSDGCAIIYNRNKFRLIQDLNLELYTQNVPTLNRENIALLAKFQEKVNPCSLFVIATTHLLYNPKREDVRISQIYKLLETITNFSKESFSAGDKIIEKMLPIILTGDFNLTPNSRGFEILTESQKCNKTYFSDQKSQNKQDNGKTDKYFQMCSIDFGENRASTLQDQWKVVDYILTSNSDDNVKSIKIENKYQLPTISSCLGHKLPNEFIGSDHFSLAIEFKII